MEKLKIEYVDINSIKPYEKNAKQHPAEQIEQIKKSIEKFGMDDPIGVWNNTIVEGHGRLIACKELGMTEVPIIRLDHLTDEERKAYTLAHNKLTMNSDFDIDMLNDELMNSFDSIDMSDFGFDLDFADDVVEEIEDVGNRFSTETKIPQYNVENINVTYKDIIDCSKYNALVDEIEAKDISDDEKKFLELAATRHIRFNYRKIAEFYVKSSKEVQELMEKSALVFIDFDDAIANGYVKLSSQISEAIENDK